MISYTLGNNAVVVDGGTDRENYEEGVELSSLKFTRFLLHLSIDTTEATTDTK